MGDGNGDGGDAGDSTVSIICGNNLQQTGESCDGTDLGVNTTCASFTGYSGTATVSCMSSCGGWDFTSCTPPSSPPCGNNNQQGNQVCDGTDLAGMSCQDFGYSGGVLGCTNCAWDVTSCTL
jgi:hypothetical protein